MIFVKCAYKTVKTNSPSGTLKYESHQIGPKDHTPKHKRSNTVHFSEKMHRPICFGLVERSQMPALDLELTWIPKFGKMQRVAK